MQRTKHLIAVTSFLAATLAAALVLVPGNADAAGEDKKSNRPKPVALDKRGRPYQHICPINTEPKGDAPPKGGRMWCSQPMPGGWWRKHGPVAKWYPNAQKWYEGNFERDKKHGTWTIYRRNGKKMRDVIYWDGTKVNEIQYDRKGKPIDPKKIAERQKAREARRRKSDDWRTYSQPSRPKKR